jgi:hypothetical protein
VPNFPIEPTVFADVRNDMTNAREEMFGPVLSISRIEDEDDAVRIANDTLYGLSGFVTSGNLERSAPGRSTDSIRKRAREWSFGSTSEVVLEAASSRTTAENEERQGLKSS